MTNGFIKHVRKNYEKVVQSIAFYPAIISICFLVLAIVMLAIDFSEEGKNLKSRLSWLSLRDASTARSILTTIAAGTVSLTVFSFSMVMILLNQAASQMSNRMLDSMIGNRFQQIVLGFYFGTIIYALFLLSTIRDISSGVYVPALSIYLLLLLTVIDIFLFIYFLHYVTQSVKFETIIKRIHAKTELALEKYCCPDKPPVFKPQPGSYQEIFVPSSDYFQGFNKPELLKFAERSDIFIQFLHHPGAYLLKGSPLLRVFGKELNEEEIKKLLLFVDLFRGQPIERNAYYGYHQLAEVAIKALSPGINDPETAVLSIHALADLFRYRLTNHLQSTAVDSKGIVRVAAKQLSFEELFKECFYPIWNYGKSDRYIQEALFEMMQQLINCEVPNEYVPLLTKFRDTVQLEMTSSPH